MNNILFESLTVKAKEINENSKKTKSSEAINQENKFEKIINESNIESNNKNSKSNGTMFNKVNEAKKHINEDNKLKNPKKNFIVHEDIKTEFLIKEDNLKSLKDILIELIKNLKLEDKENDFDEIIEDLNSLISELFNIINKDKKENNTDIKELINAIKSKMKNLGLELNILKNDKDIFLLFKNNKNDDIEIIIPKTEEDKYVTLKKKIFLLLESIKDKENSNSKSTNDKKLSSHFNKHTDKSNKKNIVKLNKEEKIVKINIPKEKINTDIKADEEKTNINTKEMNNEEKDIKNQEKDIKTNKTLIDYLINKEKIIIDDFELKTDPLKDDLTKIIKAFKNNIRTNDNDLNIENKNANEQKLLNLELEFLKINNKSNISINFGTISNHKYVPINDLFKSRNDIKLELDKFDKNEFKNLIKNINNESESINKIDLENNKSDNFDNNLNEFKETNFNEINDNKEFENLINRENSSLNDSLNVDISDSNDNREEINLNNNNIKSENNLYSNTNANIEQKETPQVPLRDFNANIESFINERTTESSFREIISLRVTPPDLGRVDIEIVKNGRSIVLNVNAENEASRNLLSRTIQNLVSILRNNGFNPVDVKVDTNQQEDLFSEDKDENNDKNNSEQNKKEDENNDDFEKYLRGDLI